MAFSHLTPRQRAVADRVLAGDTCAAIARRLGISPFTVRAHVRQIAVRLANPHGLAAMQLIRSYAAVARAESNYDFARHTSDTRAHSHTHGAHTWGQ